MIRLWTWPIVLGLLIASGLVGALVADGWGDVWSWFALGVPLVVMARCAWRRDAAPSPAPPSSPPSATP